MFQRIVVTSALIQALRSSGLLHPEKKIATILRNIGNYFPLTQHNNTKDLNQLEVVRAMDIPIFHF